MKSLKLSVNDLDWRMSVIFPRSHLHGILLVAARRPSPASYAAVLVSAANRLIGEVVQSRRRPLLGPSSWLKAATTAFTFKTLLRHNA